MATLNELFETYVNDNFSGVMSEAAIVKAYELLLGLTGDFPAKDERVQFWVDKELTVSDFVDEFLAAAARLSTENAAAWGETTAGRTAVVTAAQDEVATATTLEEVGAAVATARAENPVVTGETFTLTTSTDDVLNGTDKNDTFDATTQNSLQTGDIVLDSSSDDSDTLNAVVTTTDAEARIQNVETVNLTGEYVGVGFDLGLSSGIEDLNLDTKIAGGTATVVDANSLNAANINAGDNIKTLDVTSLSSGTRDTVQVAANKATAVNLTGSNGPDLYNVTLGAEDATVTLATLASAGDVVALEVAGDTTIDAGVAADNAELDLNIAANTAEAEITLSDVSHINAEKITLSGSQDITLKVTDGVALSDKAAGYVGTIVTDNTTATTTILGTALATGSDFRQAQVDVVDIEGVAAAATVTLNSSSKLNLSGDLGAANALTVEINNADENTTFDKGTLVVDVAESQAGALITTSRTTKGTDGTVETLLIQAKADKAVDTDLDENGTSESTITLADVQLGDQTTALVVDGEENLKLSKVTVSVADQVVTASNMTGNLTISEMVGAFDATIIGGKGNDSITTKLTEVYDIQTGEGNDVIDILTTNAAAANTKVDAGAGNDTITSSSNATTITAGAGDDTVIAGGSDTITLGDGADTVSLADNTTGTEVKDFVLGTDMVKLTSGTATVAIDLSDVAVTDGLYAFSNDDAAADAAGEWSFKLKNNSTALTATDLRDSVYLSGVTLLDASTNILGNLNDSVTVAAGKSATVTTGEGADTVTVAAGAATTVTVNDFTVGSDKIVVTGTITDSVSVNLNNVSDVSGKYTIGDATLGQNFTLKSGGSSLALENNLSTVVQLGASGSEFHITGATTVAASATGGIFNDFIKLEGISAAKATYNFSNNGGVDAVTLANGAGNELLNFNSLTGIDSTQAKVDKAADAAKTADATDGGVYVFADSSNGAGASKITTFQVDTANGYTQEVIDAEVAAFIDANLGAGDGESYVVIINDESTTTYSGKGYASVSGTPYDAYAYLVTGDADGVQADDITLIGLITESGNNIVVAADIA